MEQFRKTKNQEPFSGLILADVRTMDQTKENQTKSPVRTVVLDRTTAALDMSDSTSATLSMEDPLPSQSTFIPTLENFHEVLQAITALGQNSFCLDENQCTIRCALEEITNKVVALRFPTMPHSTAGHHDSSESVSHPMRCCQILRAMPLQG
ncbi:hypothetical protein BDR06DRAFT_969778 [Suillus hirtellus]|nr:hypothetical protein BDR06DRAFT_969778 [Suillus hirtellus]